MQEIVNEQNGIKRSWTNEEIFEKIGIPQSTGFRWLKKELKNPTSGFVASKTGPKHRGPKRLTKEQFDEVKAIINETPDKYKNETRIWTRDAVLELLAKKIPRVPPKRLMAVSLRTHAGDVTRLPRGRAN